MYISKQDLETYQLPERLGQLASDGIINNAILTAISRVKDHLFTHYDTEVVFSKTGAERHNTLIHACCIIALSILFSRLPGKVRPEWLEADYDDVLSLLERIAGEQISLELPRKPTEISNKVRFKKITKKWD